MPLRREQQSGTLVSSCSRLARNERSGASGITESLVTARLVYYYIRSSYDTLVYGLQSFDYILARMRK